jgi:UDP-N-acetyl-D-galactosamine dehydrogenase
LPVADAIIMAVAHREFLGRPLSDYQQKVVAGGCFIDVKSKFDREALHAAGLCVWRL